MTDIDQSMNDFLSSAQSTAADVEVRAGFNANWPPAGRYEATVLGVTFGEDVLKEVPCKTVTFSYATRVTGDPNYDANKLWEFEGRPLKLVPNYKSVFTGPENAGICKACEINWGQFIRACSLLGGLDLEAAKADVSGAAAAMQARLSKEPSPVAVIIIKHRPGKSGGTFPEESIVDIVNA